RRAQDLAAELRADMARAAVEAEAKLQAEKLAGAERVKEMTQQRNECKREVLELEYKLHEAQRRLRELQASSAAASSTPPPAASLHTPVPAHLASGPLRQQQHHQQGQQQQRLPTAPQPANNRQPLGSSHLPRHMQPQKQQQQPQPQKVGSYAAAAGAEEQEEEEEEEDMLGTLEALAAECQEGEGEDELEEERGGDMQGRGTMAVDGDGGGGGLDLPPGKRRRHDGDGGEPGGADGGDSQMYGSNADDEDCVMYDDGDPVPVLPRAFTGIFSRPGGAMAAAPPTAAATG
ncbi:hypothetical protein Agub_g2824, partial [Astrephomene gubernaculifera]